MTKTINLSDGNGDGCEISAIAEFLRKPGPKELAMDHTVQIRKCHLNEPSQITLRVCSIKPGKKGGEKVFELAIIRL